MKLLVVKLYINWYKLFLFLFYRWVTGLFYPIKNTVFPTQLIKRSFVNDKWKLNGKNSIHEGEIIIELPKDWWSNQRKNSTTRTKVKK